MNDEQFLLYAMKGNKDAAALATMLIRVASVWDDLIDRDQPVSDEAVHRTMCDALVRIPANPFYKEAGHLLRPQLEMGIINWMLSNELAKTPGISREIAHVARYAAGDIVIYMMALLGGQQWAVEQGVSMKLRMQRNDYAAFNAEMEALHGKGAT